MAIVLGAWPDAERVVTDVLAGLDGIGGIGAETDTALQQRLPFVQVRRIGGTDDRITDTARVDVRVYTTDRTAAKQLAEDARQLLLAGPRATVHGVLDHASTESGPQVMPAADTDDLRMVQATYRISLRR